MKLSKIPRSALPVLALLLAASAFAANKTSKGSFEIYGPLTVSGHELKPGQYKVTWEGTGGDVQAMILSQGKLVATVPAHLTDLNQPERDDAVVSRKDDDGSQSLSQVDFEAKRTRCLSTTRASALDQLRQQEVTKDPAKTVTLAGKTTAKAGFSGEVPVLTTVSKTSRLMERRPRYENS